jgi:N-acetylmuramoyl-L-alanine amidase
VIYHEARGESLAGKVAVASVVMNRVEHRAFPDNVCAVVKQPKQFAYGNRHTQKEIKFAQDFLAGKHGRSVKDSYFFTTLRVRLKRKVTHVIGGHRFYAIN